MAHSSGQINLWELSKCEVLYAVKEIHTTNITYLKVLQPLGGVVDSVTGLASGDPGSDNATPTAHVGGPPSLHTISADDKGQIYRSKFSKGLGFGLGVFNAYSAEFDCLLNGNAGVVANSCVCPSYREWNASHCEDKEEETKNSDGSSVAAGSPTRTSRSFSIKLKEAEREKAAVMPWMACNCSPSTAARVYIVLMQPVIQVLFRWNHPAPSPL